LKLPLPVSFASMFAPALLAGLCGCSVAAAKPAGAHAAHNPAESATSLLAFAARIGVTCESEQGGLSCIGGKPEVGDYYEVELHPGCGANAWLASVAAPDGADLRDRIAPIDRRTTATVSKGQKLCIEAVGRSGGHASYYYVQQLPSSALECTDNPCGHGATAPARAQGTTACTVAPDGPGHACAAGWIRGEAVEADRQAPITHWNPLETMECQSHESRS